MIYGSDIDDLSDDYKENPFVENFVETVNTEHVKNSTDFAIDSTKQKMKEETEKTKRIINIEANVKANEAEIEVSNDRRLQKIKEEEAEKKKKEENEKTII